ncbi:MAG: hypothetical protein MUF86_10695, partial [Akkermansiaceae bacterium]|nr:hypothetical protein [Akkermansiaceae bacterium]
MKPLPPATLTGQSSAILLSLVAVLLLSHAIHAQGINPDPGSGEVSEFTVTRSVPGGTIYDPLLLLPGGEAYELPGDRTGQVSITMSITHNFSGTITTSLRGADGERITSATGNNPSLTFAPLKHRYPFIITVESPTGDPVFTRLISSGNGGGTQGPGYTGVHTSHDANIESDDEYRIPQEEDGGDYDTGEKDVSSGGCGSCESSSCDLSHSNETANADTTGPDEEGSFHAGFNAGVSMQGDSQTGVDAQIDPSSGVSRSSFKSHGTGDAIITRSGNNLDTITTGSAYTKFEDVTGGVKVSISKTQGGTANRTITFINSGTNQITRTSTYGNKSVETVWSHTPASPPAQKATWTIVMGNGARKSVLTREDNGSDPSLRVERLKLYERAAGSTGVADILVSDVCETHAKTLLGWRRIKSEVYGTAGDPLTTVWEYYGPADGLVKAGLLKSVTRPDGNTESHDYYTTGYTYHTIIRPFAGGTQTALEMRFKSDSGSPSYVYDKVGNNLLSLRYDTWTSNGMIRSKHDGTVYLSTSHTITPFGADFGGIPSLVSKSDGTRTTQSHSRTNDFRNLTVIHGAPAGGSGVSEGTSTTTARDKNSIIQTRLVTAYGGTGAGTLIEDFRVTASESSTGRPTEAAYFEGTSGEYSISREYACCGLVSETDKYGLVTYHHYDDLGRHIRVNRQGVTQATVYDGLTVRNHRYPGTVTGGVWTGTPGPTNEISNTSRNLSATFQYSWERSPQTEGGTHNGTTLTGANPDAAPPSYSANPELFTTTEYRHRNPAAATPNPHGLA